MPAVAASSEKASYPVFYPSEKKTEKKHFQPFYSSEKLRKGIPIYFLPFHNFMERLPIHFLPFHNFLERHPKLFLTSIKLWKGFPNIFILPELYGKAKNGWEAFPEKFGDEIYDVETEKTCRHVPNYLSDYVP